MYDTAGNQTLAYTTRMLAKTVDASLILQTSYVAYSGIRKYMYGTNCGQIVYITMTLIHTTYTVLATA